MLLAAKKIEQHTKLNLSQVNKMAKVVPPPSIIRVIQNPETWNPTVFESLIRNDLENSSGPLAASDELLVALLVMTMDSLVEAHVKILSAGPTYMYNSGEATSAWQKIRMECLEIGRAHV